MQKKIYVANWKMNGTSKEIDDYMEMLSPHLFLETVILGLPFPYLDKAHKLLSPSLHLAAQDLSENSKGAYTGSVSGGMLKDIGCAYVIIGHSERRKDFFENNAKIAQKLLRAFENNLIPILCIGETAGQDVKRVINDQLEDLMGILSEREFMIAYEPVWAIGTGKVPTAEEISEVARFIHDWLNEFEITDIPLLYGGSVTPENISSLKTCDHISGFLIGGASLKAESFIRMIRA